MPEGKITRQGLRDHFRRLWLVYLAGALALIFLNNLVFTVTRPGFSDDETLKIMLLNTQISISEEELLSNVAHLGFKAVETEPLSVSAQDSMADMLITVKLVAGMGDIYLSDPAGYELLKSRGVCLDGGVMQLENGMYLAVIANGTNPQSALEALPIAAKMIME